MAHANAQTAVRLLEQDLEDWRARPVPHEATARQAHENLMRGLELALQRARARLHTTTQRLEDHQCWTQSPRQS